MIGAIGHIAILIAFTVSLAYFIFMVSGKSTRKLQVSFGWIQFSLVTSAVFLLYVAIFDNQFQYTYVWKHSALEQKRIFKFSAFWEGQEGSFLLWIFWNSLFVLWFSLIKKSEKLLVFLLPINAFLLSMILGVKFLGFEIGSSPFSLLKNSIKSEVYTLNPEFIPTDGQGMNALLQNYWMAIHPPMIFLGFSLAAIPFCLCLAALCYKIEAKVWVRQCMPWLLTSVGLIGLGMLMGAYWAYETLNFGGFWNWDPVENAIFIPWLVTLGAAHLGLIHLKKEKAYKALVLSILASFILVIYSTFLTRSGILGDSSVHSFTDSGLSVQLLIFLLSTIVGVVLIYVWNQKNFVPENNIKFGWKGYEFWMILAVVVLFTSAVQILLPTSFPVFNKISAFLGHPLMLATPSDQVAYYSNFQIWILFAIALLVVIAQLFYFNKLSSKKSILDLLFVPTILTTLTGLLIYWYFDFEDAGDVKYFTLILVCLLSFFMLLQLFFGSQLNLKKLSSGMAHVGLVLFFIGVLVSQGFTKIITHNNQFSDELNRWGNILLVRNKTIDLGEYKVTYNGSYVKTNDNQEIDKSYLIPTIQQNVLKAKSRIKLDEEFIERGEVVKLDAQNTFYSISFEAKNHHFDINPRVQANASMGIIASPDIDQHWNGDVYTHVSNFPDPNKSTLDWSKAKTFTMEQNDVVFEGTRSLQLASVETYLNKNNTLETKAEVQINSADSTYLVQLFLFESEEGLQVIPAEIPELGLNLVMASVENQKKTIGLYSLSQPQDWITIKSMFFPFIYLVWIGGLAMILGSFLAVFSWIKVPVLKLSSSKIKFWNKEKLVFNLSK